MCRNIKRLHNIAPPATDDELRDAALQFVRKISGSRRPSRANEVAFERSVERITATLRELLDSLVTTAAPLDREALAEKARRRAARRGDASPRTA